MIENRTLYSYWRSSTSYKVRIALNLKELDYSIVPINLVKGEHKEEDYLSLNPSGAVPTLIDGDNHFAQSNTILEYLEEVYPDPECMPSDPAARAYARQIINIISCDIHPVNNLRVLRYLSNNLDVSDDDKTAWYHHWIHEGFKSLEALIQNSSFYEGEFCTGDEVGFAEATLIPQMYNARRFDVDLNDYPALCDIEQRCLDLPAFQNAVPEAQIDSVKSAQ